MKLNVCMYVILDNVCMYVILDKMYIHFKKSTFLSV